MAAQSCHVCHAFRSIQFTTQTRDFSSRLLFPIDHVRAVTLAGGAECGGYKASFSGYTLSVETSNPVTSVFVEVDASSYSPGYT